MHLATPMDIRYLAWSRSGAKGAARYTVGATIGWQDEVEAQIAELEALPPPLGGGEEERQERRRSGGRAS